tara:strand:- start:254 stop:742 length:489 start_codon:yes stop_codon:yes gene_type:complete
MSYTLEQFAADCKQALSSGANPQSLDSVRANVSRACLDQTFVDTHLGEHNSTPRKLLYQDDELGFCIFAHVYLEGANNSKPHDHGPSWAVYGQAVGETVMTDWQANDDSGVQSVQSYALTPGDAYVYDVGDIHSPAREGPTRLIRVEGVNMDGVERRWFELP